MANALPRAIGAQLAYPKRRVISVSGEGKPVHAAGLPIRRVFGSVTATSKVVLNKDAGGVVSKSGSNPRNVPRR